MPTAFNVMASREELMKICTFELSDADKAVLEITDEEFKPHTWEELKQVIGMEQCA